MTGVILVRTTDYGDHALALARALSAASGCAAALLVDERIKPAGSGATPKVSLTNAACRALGLFTPSDFAWRCGDYGLYLARRQLPDASFFWLVEDDVRMSRPDLFFQTFAAATDVDFVAARIRPAEPDWGWSGSVLAHDAEPYRCFFPVVRLSTHALDMLLAQRVRQSRRLNRRLLWPNDESFVATSIVRSGLAWRDLNDFGTHVYEKESFSYTNLIKEERFAPECDVAKLYHPVLSADRYRAKAQRTRVEARQPGRASRLLRRGLMSLNSRLRW